MPSGNGWHVTGFHFLLNKWLKDKLQYELCFHCNRHVGYRHVCQDHQCNLLIVRSDRSEGKEVIMYNGVKQLSLVNITLFKAK